MPSYQKLVRDRIPEIIEAAGKKPVTHILDEAAYLDELDRKLNEECAEYQESKSLEELADMLEVMYAIAEARGYSVAELEAIREKKAAERGGFGRARRFCCRRMPDSGKCRIRRESFPHGLCRNGDGDRRRVYGIAAIAGAAVYTTFSAGRGSVVTAAFLSMAVTVAIRILAIHYRWNLPSFH